MRWLILLPGLLLSSDLVAQQEPTRWRLSEELRLGSMDGPLALTRVADITTSPDGRYLYVLESAERSVWMFEAASGELLRKIGRGGDGPGEFRQPLKLGWQADTLYVTDAQLSRISLFDEDGEFLRTITFPPPVLPETGLGTAAIGYTAGGDVLMVPRVASHHVRGGQLAGVPWYLFNTAGEVVRPVGYREFRGAGATVSFGSAIAADRSVDISLPLTDRNFIGIEPDGESLLLLSQPAGTDEAGRFRLVRMLSNGDTAYARSYRYTPCEVSKVFRDSVLEEQTSRYAEGLKLQPARVRGALEDRLTFPEHHPPFTALRGWLTVGRDGSAWLRREDVGGPTVSWLVVSPSGDVAGAVTAPRSLVILHAEAGKVWGVVADEYNIPYVVGYRVVARDGG